MFDPEIFGFEKWNAIIGERYNLFFNNENSIYHLTKTDKTWLIELIEENKKEVLYRGYIPNNSFAFELFNNFESKIPGLYDLDI